MSGVSDGVTDGEWVLVAAAQPAASEFPPPADSEIANDDATAATAATAATVTSHDEAVARGQMMAATAPPASTATANLSPPASTAARPFDRLPDNGLAKVLATLKQSEHRRCEVVCARWRRLRPRASLARVKSLHLDGVVVTLLARRFRNASEYY